MAYEDEFDNAHVNPDQAAGRTGQPNFAEREFEVGEDEFWKAAMANLYNNSKRTYDEYQHESLESVRRNSSYVQKVLSDAQQYDNMKAQIAVQALQNAVETANMVGKKAVENMDENHKQSIDHRDISTTANLGVGVAAEAVTAAVAKAVDSSITPLIGTLTELVKALSANTTAQVKAVQ